MHYVESGQIASLSCWLLATPRARAEDAQFGPKSPMDGKLGLPASDSASYYEAENKPASVIVLEINAHERSFAQWSPFDTGVDLHRSGTFPSGATPIGGSCSRPANSSLLPGVDLRCCRCSCTPKQRMGIWSWFCYCDCLERDGSFHHAPHTDRRGSFLAVAPQWARRAARADDGNARRNRAFHSYFRYDSADLTLQHGDPEVVEVRRRWRSVYSVFCSACSSF
jgi:hypothetical protein